MTSIPAPNLPLHEPPLRRAQSDRRLLWWAGGMIAALTLIAYIPAMRGGFIWDDDYYVPGPALQSLHGLWRIWFEPGATPQCYPLTHTTLWLEHLLWGMNPTGYHVTNVLLHAANAILIWLLLRRLAVPGAWLAGAIFALHPVHVESVAWITERKNVQSGLFYLLSLWMYLRFLERPSPQPSPGVPGEGEGSPAWKWYALSLGLFLAALLSKTVTSSLPAVVLLVIWWKRGRLTWRDVLPLLPTFVLGAALGYRSAWTEQHHVGAMGPDWDFSFAQRCLIASQAVWFYLWKLLWPAKLSFIYPMWDLHAVSWWQYALGPAALIIVAGLYLVRHRLGRGPLVAVLFFGGTLLPALGFANVFPMRFSFVADHFQYLASIGIIALAAAALYRLGRWLAARSYMMIPVLLVPLAVLTWRQGGIYRDPETLWEDTLAKNPSCWMAYNNYGLSLTTRAKTLSSLQREELLRRAAHYFRRSIEIKPDDADAYIQLGKVYEQWDQPDEAARQYAMAMPLYTRCPVGSPGWRRGAEPRLQLGTLLYSQGKVPEAIEQYEAALRLNPDHEPVHTNLGRVLTSQRRFAEAVEHYHQALRINPESTYARTNWAGLLMLQGDLPQAAEQIQAVLRIDPNNAKAWTQWGGIMASTGRFPEAIDALSRALKSDPNDPDAQRLLTKVMAKVQADRQGKPQ